MSKMESPVPAKAPQMKYPMPRSYMLSKSTFMRGCQCTKSLWLYKHRRELMSEMDPQTLVVLDKGTDLGVLARSLFPGGLDLTPPTPFDYSSAVAATYKALFSGHQVLYEAAFQYDRVLAAMDILCQTPRGWIAYEVKSATSVREQHILDAALQYWVITNSATPLGDICIITVDKEHFLQEKHDIHQLFNETSVLDQVLALQEEIGQKVAQYKEVLKQSTEPLMDIGSHCSSPYECNFKAYCWTNGSGSDSKPTTAS